MWLSYVVIEGSGLLAYQGKKTFVMNIQPLYLSRKGDEKASILSVWRFLKI
jgi:hypothetical protein